MDPSLAPTTTEINQPSTGTDNLLIQIFAKLDKTALGIGVGTVSGLAVFAATIILLIKNGYPVGPNLSLLGQYFAGYTVSWKGSVVGLGYGFIYGFLVGWFLAFLRNLFVATFILIAKLKANLSSFDQYLDSL